MTYLATAWAWFSGLGWVAKAGATFGVLSPALAFFNPVLSVLGILWTAIKTAISWVFQALELIVTHPVILSVVLLAYVGGRWQQHHADLSRIESAQIEAQNVASRVRGAEDVEAAKAKAAIAAREQAKVLPLLEPNVVITTDHPVKVAAPPLALNPGPTASELRNAKRVRSRPVCASLFCP